MRPRSLATGSALVLVAGEALAAESASFRLDGVVDAAGGQSASASHVVSACIGSEIAGSQASASFRIDSGCGATALLALPKDRGMGGLPDTTVGVPTLSDTTMLALAALLAAVGAFRLRRRRG